jgi:ABC-type sugar transport system substrate-binding protein
MEVINEYATCFELGKSTALYYQSQFPDQQPVVLINNSRTVTSDIERERGFIDGFHEVYPEAEVINNQEDNGVVESVMDNVQAALLHNPKINVIYNTSDTRALGTMLALERLGRRKQKSALVASVGGSAFAMNEILDPESAWKSEVGLLVRKSAEKSYEVLVKMMEGEIPLKTDEEFLIQSKVFVNPQLEEVQEYLRENHKVEE